MLRRLRRRVRLINYYSAARNDSPWQRSRERAFVLALVAAVPATMLSESLVQRERTRETISGGLGGTAGGPFVATVANADGRFASPDPLYGSWTLRSAEEQRGWPFPSQRQRSPVRLDLNVYDEAEVRLDARLPADAPERVAIDRALERATDRSPAQADKIERFLAASGRGDVPTSGRFWRGTLANGSLWWLMLTAASWLAIGAARILWFLFARRRVATERTLLARNKCATCGYDLRGLEFHARCPECGAARGVGYTATVPDLVLVDPAGPVATVTLNQPDRRNPTSIAMLDAVDAALDACDRSDDLRVIVLAGAGRSFCSGLDLGEARGGDAVVHTLLHRLSEVMRRLRRTAVPVIAHVQGAAIGGGFGFMAACDFAVTHPEAKVGYPPPDLGLSPALMAPWLVRKIGPSRARAMLLEGGTISGAAAHAAGIASHLAERDDLDDAVGRLAATIAGAGRESTRRMKAFLNDLDGSTDDELLDRAAVVSAEVIAHPETQARLAERFGPG